MPFEEMETFTDEEERLLTSEECLTSSGDVLI